MAQIELEQRGGSADLLGLPLDIPSEGVMSPNYRFPHIVNGRHLCTFCPVNAGSLCLVN